MKDFNQFIELLKENDLVKNKMKGVIDLLSEQNFPTPFTEEQIVTIRALFAIILPTVLELYHKWNQPD